MAIDHDGFSGHIIQPLFLTACLRPGTMCWHSEEGAMGWGLSVGEQLSRRF